MTKIKLNNLSQIILCRLVPVCLSYYIFHILKKMSSIQVFQLIHIALVRKEEMVKQIAFMTMPKRNLFHYFVCAYSITTLPCIIYSD